MVRRPLSSPPILRLTAVGALIAAGLACALPDRSGRWQAQLEPESPCYDVDLMDGIDTSSTAELHATFECLDYHGHLHALHSMRDTFDTPLVSGQPIGLALVDASSELVAYGTDPMALLTQLSDALTDSDLPLVDAVLELLVPVPARQVREAPQLLQDPVRLSSGLAARSGPLVPLVASVMAERPTDRADFGAWLADRTSPSWTLTLDALARTPSAAGDALRGLPTSLGLLLDDVASPSNDRWPLASGHSLRDALRMLLRNDAALVDDLAIHLVPALDDRQVRQRLDLLIGEHAGDDTLAAVGPQLALMTRVDKSGGALSPGERSALTTLLELLAATNQPMTCEIDLVLTTLDLDLGNVAVTLLEAVADWSLDDVTSTSETVADLLGSDLGADLIGDIADSGVCPALTPQVVADLEVLEVLYDPRFEDLLVVFLDLLKALRDGDDNHLGATADLVTAVVDDGALPPLEELFRDIGGSEAIEDVVTLLPALTSSVSPPLLQRDGETIAGLNEVLDGAVWLLAPAAGRPSGWTRLEPYLLPLHDHPSTWAALDSLRTVLTAQDASLTEMVTWLPEWIDRDPDLDMLDTLADVIRHDALVEPLLGVAEQGSLLDAMLDPAPAAGHAAPMGWLGTLMVDGTLDALTRTLNLVLDGLEDDNERP
ncbi:MAG: hypothetical protein ACON5B_05905 [Myxococcota bacterium]